jgi:hypothetical protein
MKRKSKFLRAVQVLAPGDPFIHRAAQRVEEASLPLFPGGVALEFVAAMERLRTSVAVTSAICAPQCKRRMKQKPALPVTFEDTHALDGELALQDAMHLKNAEFRLKLGQPTEALAELEALSPSLRKLPPIFEGASCSNQWQSVLPGLKAKPLPLPNKNTSLWN